MTALRTKQEDVLLMVNILTNEILYTLLMMSKGQAFVAKQKSQKIPSKIVELFDLLYVISSTWIGCLRPKLNHTDFKTYYLKFTRLKGVFGFVDGCNLYEDPNKNIEIRRRLDADNTIISLMQIQIKNYSFVLPIYTSPTNIDNSLDKLRRTNQIASGFVDKAVTAVDGIFGINVEYLDQAINYVAQQLGNKLTVFD